MQQEDTMLPTLKPTVVLPPVYELQFNMWRWCNLREVCAAIPDLARRAEINFSPTPEDLVSRFAGLAHFNKEATPSLNDGKKVRRKFFRYSVGGDGFMGAEVPTHFTAPREFPPYVPFSLDIPQPYPDTLFVPEGWAIDTLKAIRLGVTSAVDHGDMSIGFFPKDHPRGMVVLKGKPGTVLAMAPDQ